MHLKTSLLGHDIPVNKKILFTTSIGDQATAIYRQRIIAVQDSNEERERWDQNAASFTLAKKGVCLELLLMLAAQIGRVGQAESRESSRTDSERR